MEPRAILPALLGTVFLLVPVVVSPEGVQLRVAACSEGTCCPQEGSDCIINNILTENAYARPKGGSCEVQPVP